MGEFHTRVVHEGQPYAELTADDFVAGMQHILDMQTGMSFLLHGLVKNASDNLNNNFSDSGNPATVSFGGVRFDGNLSLRLWADGSADKVNFGTLGFSGSGGIAFAFQDGDEPNRNKWVIGTKPKSVPVPPTAARLWRISAKPIDETTDQLIASPVTGLFILVQ